MIVAAALRWRGVRFRELSVSVLVRAGAGDADRRGGLPPAGVEAQADSRGVRAGVLLDAGAARGESVSPLPGAASIQLVRGGEIIFAAAMHGDGSADGVREPTGVGEGGWSGPVFLPGKAAAAPNGRGKLFFARAAGVTETHPFRSGTDTLTIRLPRDCAALAALVESHFVPTEWSVRPDATHSKSKTYRRAVALA